jgi:transposase
LAKWGLPASEYSDPYGKKARQELEQRLERLPEQTRWATRQMLVQLDGLSVQIKEFEKRLEELVESTPAMQWLETLPGVGVILSATMALEIGDIKRFLSAERLASYSGTVPRVHSSGDRTRYGRTRPDVNRYLKWAFAEAANSTAVNHRRFPERHVSQLYARLRARKGHNKAVGAVARHLAEAAFHVLSRQQAYRDPTNTSGSDQRGVNAMLS